MSENISTMLGIYLEKVNQFLKIGNIPNISNRLTLKGKRDVSWPESYRVIALEL